MGNVHFYFPLFEHFYIDIYNMFHMYQFEDFFSEDEMEEMIGFYSEKNQEESRLINVGNLYIFLYYIDGYDGPAKVDFRDYLDGEVVYTWLNDEVELEVDADYDDIQSGYLFFPYLYQGRKAWQTWQEDEWLQGFAKKEDVKKIENREYDFYSVSHGTIESEGNRGSVYYLFEWTDYEKAELTANKYGFELRHRIHPWMAAIDYMKYIYLAGVVLLLLCLFIVFYVIRKMNEQKKVMEHQRRDFINAAAHELKTPLGIIRGFAENVKENTVEDKKEYYLNQIIFQTEKMDDLVKEMIGMSKMNTSDMKMDCERISVKGILEEQLEKLQPLMTEKQILLEQDWLDDFVMEGDKNYLGKAFCTTCCAFLL